MNQPIESLPNDPDQLKELVIRLQDKCTHLETELCAEQIKTKHQSVYINQLIEAIALARQQHFGSRSEKFNSDQLSLLFNEAETLSDYDNDNAKENAGADGENKNLVAAHARRKGKGGRKKLPDHFPHIEIVYELEQSECACERCQSPAC